MHIRKGLIPSVVFAGVSLVALGGVVLASNEAAHQAQQSAPIKLGCTGGSVQDISRFFCCSGTLGCLVRGNSNGTLYILSNSHVLGLSGRGTVGDDISHVGYVDANCQIRTIVADLSAQTLGGCCDAAIAQIRSGQVDTSGNILDVGVPCSSTASAFVGQSVKKSGRTTGITTGSVSSVNNTVSVRYPKSCGSGGGTVKTFTGQIGIGPSTFSGGGDSGSVIFNTANQAVGLLFAGSSSTTFANQIGPVLSTFNVSVVGSTCITGSSEQAPYTEEDLAAATAVLERHSARIMSKPLVLGHGVGLNENNELVLRIYMERITGLNHRPMSLEGYPVEFVDLGGPIYFLGCEEEAAK
jgi:hypothetical protein